MRPDGNCRSCMVEIKGERVLAPSCCRKPAAGHGSDERQRARAALAEDDRRAPALRHAGASVYKPDSELEHWRRTLGVGKPRFARARAARGRPLASGDGGQPRRLHPVHALRARLPRGAGQRRHRLRLPRRAFEHRVRPGRSDGRVDLRRVRRMRAGVPDRRARAGARRLPRADRQEGARRCARTAASAARSPTTSRQRDRPRRRAATARPTTSGCASRAASASTTSRIRSA